MGVARGVRQAVAGDAGQREFDGCLETLAMTDGDVGRLHSGARAHYRPDGGDIRHHANLLCESHPLNFQAQANKLVRALPVSSD